MGCSVAAIPLCYRPTEFFRHIRVIALSLPQRKLWHAFQNSIANSSLPSKLRKPKVLLIQGGFVVLKI
jgi:hypothetical protein